MPLKGKRGPTLSMEAEGPIRPPGLGATESAMYTSQMQQPKGINNFQWNVCVTWRKAYLKSGYGRGEDLGAAIKQVIWQAFGLPAPYGYLTFPLQAWLTEQLSIKLKEYDYDMKSVLEESSDITVDVPHLPPPSAAHQPPPDQIPTLVKPSDVPENVWSACEYFGLSTLARRDASTYQETGLQLQQVIERCLGVNGVFRDFPDEQLALNTLISGLERLNWPARKHVIEATTASPSAPVTPRLTIHSTGPAQGRGSPTTIPKGNTPYSPLGQRFHRSRPIDVPASAWAICEDFRNHYEKTCDVAVVRQLIQICLEKLSAPLQDYSYQSDYRSLLHVLSARLAAINWPVEEKMIAATASDIVASAYHDRDPVTRRSIDHYRSHPSSED